jgi:hypothetical protein
MIDVELREAATGKLEAKAPLITWDDTRPECAGDGIKASARGTIAQRAKLAQGVLADLGFSPANIERGSEPSGNDAEKRTSSFPKHKIGVVAKDGMVRALRKDTELGHVTGLEQLVAATYVAELNAIVVTTRRPGREACEGSDPTEVDLLKLP